MMTEIVYSLVHGAEVGRNRRARMDDIFPNIEGRLPDEERSKLDQVLASGPPRMCWTHLPAFIFEKMLQHPETCPHIIWMVREPKDALVSFYHWYRKMKSLNFNRSWNYSFSMVKENRVLGTNILDNMTSWWKVQDHPKVLMVKYEDVLENRKLAIQKVAAFLGKCPSEEEIDQIDAQGTFEAMKMRGTDSYHYGRIYKSSFFRKGVVGDWKNYFSQEQADYMDKCIEEKLGSIGFHHYSYRPAE